MTTKRVRLTETADLAAVSSHFRLFDLPFDLREYITRFVDRKTAARLLTLSSGFHELFARCVWLYIDEKVFDSRISKKTRKRAFTRYGRLVRCVDIRLPLDGLDYSIDLSQLLPNVTVYAFEIGGYGSSKKQALHLINAVSGFHGLKALKVIFETAYIQVCLEPLADAFFSRQKNQNWQRLQRLRLVFRQFKQNCPWTDIVDFVVKVTPLQIDNFDIVIKGDAYGYPTAEQMTLLAPHLTRIPDIYELEYTSRCRAHHNRIVYNLQPTSGNGESVVFSHLESLYFSLCCASSTVCNYANFTPARFPRVGKVSITVFNCGRDTMFADPTFVHPVLSHCWSKVSKMSLDEFTFSPTLYTVLDHNPQITNLSVVTAFTGGLNTIQSNHFSLADILKRLPMLDTLSILLKTKDKFYGSSANNANSNEDNDLMYIKNSRLRDIRFNIVAMTSDCLEMLYMLPKLEEIKIRSCSLYRSATALKKIKHIQQLNSKMDSDKYGARIKKIRFENIDFTTHGNWSAELAVAMVAAAPNIKSVKFGDITSELRSAIRKKIPHCQVKIRSFTR